MELIWIFLGVISLFLPTVTLVGVMAKSKQEKENKVISLIATVVTVINLIFVINMTYFIIIK